MSAWVWSYPQPHLKSRKAFFPCHSRLGSASGTESWPAYTKALAQGPASEGGDYWWQQRSIRELLPHSNSLVPHRLSWGCICDQISNCSPWCAKCVYIPPWPARVVWKQTGPLCFAASSLAQVLFRGQGVILNMTQGLGLMCALQLVFFCLKQDSPIKATGVQPALRNCPPEWWCSVLCPESPKHNDPLETIKNQWNWE